jgi:protein involved in polysaccharide export with SLBB domain
MQRNTLSDSPLVARCMRAFLPIFLFCAIAAGVAQSVENYKLSPNDLLDFRVFQEPELDGVVRVAGDGTAIVPLVGPVPVAGRTVGEATQAVAAKLHDGYLVHPQVSITVRQYAKKLFTVLGEVQKPGSYDMQGLQEITLLQAVGMAGGYTKIADPGNVTIKRVEGGAEKVLKFNAKKMAKGTDKSSFMIKPGDVISVGESMF